MTDYITLEELKASSELTGFSFVDNDARLAIAAASVGIDEYTDRQFNVAGTISSVRYYTPLDGYSLQIDDATSIGTVEVDYDGDGTFETVWTANTDYVLEPLNAAADGKPYEEIHRHPRSAYRFSCYPRSVKVTATFGWPALPPPVKEATTIIATRLLKRAREAPFGVVNISGTESGAVHVARTDPDTCFLLDPFIRGQGVMVA